MVINPEAEKLVRAALRGSEAGRLKLVLLPGAANTAAAKKPRAAKTGSVQAKAMDHPVVQQAQREAALELGQHEQQAQEDGKAGDEHGSLLG